MSVEKIQDLRDLLNEMLLKYEVGSEEVLYISRELDILIVEYMKQTS